MRSLTNVSITRGRQNTIGCLIRSFTLVLACLIKAVPVKDIRMHITAMITIIKSCLFARNKKSMNLFHNFYVFSSKHSFH